MLAASTSQEKSTAPSLFLRLFLVFIFSSLAASSQVVAYFSPQPATLPGLTRYSVQVCSHDAATFAGGLVYAAAQTKLAPVTRGPLQEQLTAQSKRSPWRYVGWGLAVAAWGASAAQAQQAIVIKENIKPLIPIGAAGVTALMAFTGRQVPSDKLPSDLIPPLIQLPAGGCAEFSMYGSGAAVAPFSREVK